MKIPECSARGAQLRRNLQSMALDGFAFSVMVGIAETYLPAFMLARGFGELNAALIATLPVLLGSLLQLAAPRMLQRVGSYRAFVVTTASLQAVSMLALCLLALQSQLQPWVVFVPATLYWAAGLSTGPAWNTWVEQLVPLRVRSSFFARRSRMCHLGVLLGLISGGLLLRWAAQRGLTESTFAVLFGVGAVGRFVSAAMLARQADSTHRAVRIRASVNRGTPGESRRPFVRAALGPLRRPAAATRLVLFLSAMQIAVHVSGPYFNPFMLKVLQLSWVDYMGLLSLGFIGKMLSLAWAGRFANRWGADRLLWVGSVGIVPISALWFVRQDIWFLAGLQILSGLVWGCYELAMLLLFFGRIPAERRVAVLTLYNAGNSAAMVCGTFLGARILNMLGRNHAAYLTVFVASGCLRMCALLALPGRRLAMRTTREAVTGFVARTRQSRRRSLVPGTSGLSSAGHSSAVLSSSLTGAGADVSSVVFVLPPTTSEMSSSARRVDATREIAREGGGGGAGRRRDMLSASGRQPARTLDLPGDVGPAE
jgi:MFS family permease